MALENPAYLIGHHPVHIRTVVRIFSDRLCEWSELATILTIHFKNFNSSFQIPS